MLRLSLLVVAALVLPNTGQKPSELASRPMSISTIANAAFPSLHFPRLPRFKYKKEYDVQVALMKLRLKDLVGQQESFYAEHSSYTKNQFKLPVRGDSTAANVVQLQILFAGKKGWSAIASHPDAPGKSCVIFVGDPETLPIIPRTRAEGNEATIEGAAACDSR